MNGDTAEMRPVFDKGRNSRAVGSSSTVWTLPPCQVTVRPRDRGQFWDEVKAKVEGLSGDADAGARLAVSDVQLIPSRVPASDPVGSTGQDRAGAAASSEGLQAFPVLQGATHNTYQPLAWQALSELHDVVGKYGLGSAEVMQVLRSFNASLLTPFDIRSLARAFFPPVEYDFFENKWTQLAVRAVERNTTLGPGDPRRMVNIDMLMGTGNYTRAEGQAGYEPLVQEQCQQTGMAALVQIIQLLLHSSPLRLSSRELMSPSLRGSLTLRLTAAVEKQVSDPAARKLMIQSVAQGNCNAACKRIIEALPGEPSMSDMVGACAKLSPSSQQVVAVHTAVQPAVATIVQPTVATAVQPAVPAAVQPTVAAAVQPAWVVPQGVQQQQWGARARKKQSAESVVIDSDKIHKVPLDTFGPLGDGMSAFLMGRSSATIQGIIVHLGLIDADFSGQIHAMVSTATPPLTIPKGTRIAQLVPFKSSVSRTEDRSRGDGGFGSTGPPQVRWTAVLTKDRPETLCTVSMVGATPSEIHLCGLLDTGADVSILSLAAWAPQWPLTRKDNDLGLRRNKAMLRAVGSGAFGTIYQSLEYSCLLYQKEVWEMEVATRPPKDQCRDGRHGDIAGWYAIAYHASCGLAGPHCGSEGLFFTIPLHPDDRPKFAFTVPTKNNAEPAQRYQWRVLPQGMQNSPRLCQWYVARALSGVRKQFPDAHVYHYMDDILVATPTQEELLRLQPQLLNALRSHGLQVAPEKVQQQPPWKYLGVKILERTIRHQEVQFVQSVKTLNDAQKLVGVITWLRPYLGLTTAQLSPLFELLKGDTDLKSPRELTPEARKVLEEVQQAVLACQVYRIEPSIDVTVFITTPDLHPTGIIGQWNDDWTDPLHVVEWVFLPHQPHKTATALFELIARLIIKCRQRCLQLMGADPSKILLPVQREEFDWSYANNVSLQSALEGFSGQITYHLPSHKLLQVAKNTQFSLRPKSSQEPVQGPTVFTDGSGETGKAIVTWQDGSEWQVLEGHEDGSAQLVELKAAVMAFEKFSQEPFNLITDSAYVADIAQRLSCSVLKEVSNPALFDLLKALWCAIQARVHPYYVLHVRSHTNLPGFVAEGVNPRGLKALELWQTDVTQVAEFGRLKYVHITMDTFSSAMWASAHTGEKARDVIAHWRQAFAVLGIPSAVKTDNGPAYASQQVQQFLQSWGVSHNFGIPHSQTGQAIVERNHGTLKRVLQKQKWGMQGETPNSRLAKALYTINHLTVPQNSNNPVILNHHLSLQASDGEQQPRAKVRVRNLVTKQWEGPYDLIAMGRGYACVSTDTGTRWLPSKCVRPDLRPQRQNSADRQGESRDQLESHQVDESSSDHSDDSSTDSD
ncbi:hypothetical protein DUI87_11318 [Hirundo rustica rustica]|uniref:ribonuclease H n=1 Tax=Hirundo rustica rustica TaxID=333673 RepID=A0A3M0KG80_HIRRU|nr:hypothetical protein DUI87_11318 [Hirundo rustica rustica]